MIDNNEQRRIDRGFAIAAIIAAIPSILWASFVLLLFSFIVMAVYFNQKNLQGFTALTLLWITRLLIVAGIVLLLKGVYKAYLIYHQTHMHIYERRTARAASLIKQEAITTKQLQNEDLRIGLEIKRQLPILIKYAVDNNHNIEYTAKGDLRVTSYLSNIHSLQAGEATRAAIAPVETDYLPQPYNLSDVLQNFTPSKDGILLARKESNIIVPSGEALCHTVFTGNTDSGKTNNERMLLIQLLYIGEYCFLCDRNFQAFREDKKLGVVYDYRPIEAQLQYPAIDKSSECLQLLKYLVGILDDRRIQRRKALVRFRDIYLFMDELPAFCKEQPYIMDYVGRLLREARQYGIFFVGAAQDLLNNTLNNDNGAIRDNLLTNYYGGGDSTTAKMVLNIGKGESIDERGLGKAGVVYLRAKGADIDRVKCRTPLSDNNATLMLLEGRKPVQQLDSIPYFVDSTPATPVERQGTISSSSLTDDMQLVLNAFNELTAKGESTTLRAIAERTPFQKDKVNSLLNELVKTGKIVREKKAV